MGQQKSKFAIECGILTSDHQKIIQKLLKGNSIEERSDQMPYFIDLEYEDKNGKIQHMVREMHYISFDDMNKIIAGSQRVYNAQTKNAALNEGLEKPLANFLRQILSQLIFDEQFDDIVYDKLVKTKIKKIKEILVPPCTDFKGWYLVLQNGIGVVE